MKKFLKFCVSLLFLSQLLSSCDNRNEFLKNINTSPELTISSNIEDTLSLKKLEQKVKVFKGSGGKLTIKLFPIDKERNISSFSYTILEGSEKDLKIDSSGLNQFLLSKQTQDFVEVPIIVNSIGSYFIRFITTDVYGKSDFVELRITGFDNYLPVANFEIIPIKVNSDFEYEFDASTSYDADSSFGGKITTYIFTINGLEVISNIPKIKYVFPKRGNIEVKLKVLDDDQAYSLEIKKISSI